MPTITLNRKVVEKLVGRKLPTEKLKDRIAMLGTDLEGINDKELTVEIFPNRPDMLSEQGFARALASFTGTKTGLKCYKTKKSNAKVIVERSVKGVRPYTACSIVKNLKFNDQRIKEIIQLQEKLHLTFGRNRKKVAIGVYPYDKIKPPIRYTALEPDKIRFRPLESEYEMTAQQILENTQAGRSYGHLLAGQQKYPIFIDSAGNVLSMPPIINSHLTGKINETTEDVFIECSGFDYETLSICINIITTALADIGGNVYTMDICYPDGRKVSPDLRPRTMKLDINYANRILGLNLKDAEIKRCLVRMGLGYKNRNVLIPCYRVDIMHQIDLIEDIGIAYGYENFREEIKKLGTEAGENQFEIFKNKIADIMVGFGFVETKTYHLISREVQTKNCNLDADVVELENATADYNSLRFWMMPSLLNVLKDNKHNEYPQKIFEAATVFKKDRGVVENDRLAVLICHAAANYTDARQILDALLKGLNVEYKVKKTVHPSFIPGRVARVSVKNKDVAYIGELSPEVLSNFELEMPVAGFELNLTDLFGLL